MHQMLLVLYRLYYGTLAYRHFTRSVVALGFTGACCNKGYIGRLGRLSLRT